jgi:hypothetical protein
MHLIGGLLLCVTLLDSSAARARDVFINTVSGPGLPTRSAETHAIGNVFGIFGADSLAELLGPDYTDDSLVVSRIDLRGVGLVLGFPANSRDLVISLPQLDSSVTWSNDRISRDRKIDLIEAWLEGKFELPTSGDGSMTPLLRAFIKYSSVDPVAGNPNSLQTKMVEADLFLAESGSFVDIDPATGEFEVVDNWLRVEADFSYFDAAGIRGESYDIGVGYGLNLPNRKMALLFDLPLVLTRSGSGGLSYMISGALGLQYRVKPWWNVTPVFRMGFSGSFDLAALAVLYSGSVVSTMQWKLKGFDVAMGNLIGVESNIDRVKYFGMPVEYDLLMGIFENGLTVGRPMRTRFFDKELSWQGFYRLSSFVGNELFLANQHAVGLRYSTGDVARGLAFETGWAGGKDYNSLRIRFLARF